VQFAAAVNGGDGDEASAQLPARKHPSLHLLRLHGVVSYATSLPGWRLELGLSSVRLHVGYFGTAPSNLFIFFLLKIATKLHSFK
jgi:hypothetical protein